MMAQKDLPNNSTRLAIIPARAGSKRIPGKNVRPFLGKPILAYAIETAQRCGLFSEVMVSTDSEDIAAVARAYGAEIPFLRSSENADDMAGTKAVIEEVTANYAGIGKSFDAICCIYPTAVLLQPDTLKLSCREFEKSVDSVTFAAVKYGHPIWRAFEVGADESARFFFPEHSEQRSQDLPQAWHDAGMFYWMKPAFLSRGLPLLHTGAHAFTLPEIQVQDIDNEEDWCLAEAKYAYLNRV